MKKEEKLPIYEVCGNDCIGILENGRLVTKFRLKKIKNFLGKE